MRAKFENHMADAGGKLKPVVVIQMTIEEVSTLNKLAEFGKGGPETVRLPSRMNEPESKAVVVFELVNCARCAGLPRGPVCASCADDLRMEQQAEEGARSNG